MMAPTTAMAEMALVKRHQRRVQQPGDPADDADADEGGEHEDEEQAESTAGSAMGAVGGGVRHGLTETSHRAPALSAAFVLRVHDFALHG